MVVIKRFRTVWGVEAGKDFENWIPWFPDLKKQGYGEFLAQNMVHADTNVM